MNTLNLQAIMKTQNRFSTDGSSPLQAASARRAQRRPQRGFRAFRRWPVRSSGGLALLLCLAWLALPRAGRAQPANYTNETVVANYVNGLLYWQDAAPTNQNIAAFRYKVLLYTNDNGILPDFDNMASLYGANERTRSQLAEAELQCGLTNNPDSALLSGLMLDIYYDRAEAEAIFAGLALQQAQCAHFGPPIANPAPTNGFIIDNEIAAYEEALASNQVALAAYCALLTNSLGVPDVADTPLGYRIFQEDVPGRALDPASYLGSNGVLDCVIPCTNALFTGYKDLVLLYQLLSAQGSTAATLANLYFLRNGAGDESAGQDTITAAQRSLFLHTELLRTAFPDLNLNDAALTNSGVAAALAGVSDSLADLDKVKQAQRGGLNPLGFDTNFLVLLDSGFSGEGTYPDTYDALLVHLASPNSTLGVATNALAAAGASYASYRGYHDQLATESDSSSSSYAASLQQIVGVAPSDPTYVTYPMGAPGSQLSNQFLNVSSAELAISNISVQMDAVYQTVAIDLAESGAESNAYINYGTQEATVQEEIGKTKAIQAAANAIASGISDAVDSFGVSVGAQALNAEAQYLCEDEVGDEQADLANLSAMQSATIEGIQNAAQVKTTLLQLGTLAVDMQEAQVNLEQQVNTLVGLQRQKSDLEQSLAQCSSNLTDRYFADPVHQLAMQADMVTADAAFQQAQEWLFFMARALEYKWDESLQVVGPNGVTYEMADLFKLRNANELENMYNAMKSFDDLEVMSALGNTRFDWFSVRDDFLGYAPTNDLGQENFYVDPVTGQTNDGIAEFRLYLSRQVTNGSIVLNLNTVRQIVNETFFTGPTYLPDGSVDSSEPGCYLDKITRMMIRLPGGFATDTQVAGYLLYGGTSYIRNRTYGTNDPLHPDRIIGEMTPYSTRHWDYDAANNNWVFTDGLSAQIAMMMAPRTEPRLNGSTNNPDVLPSQYEIGEFQERSVATTGWVLQIPVTGANSVTLSNLDDIEIYFYHYSFDRQD
jgi:hypothetical protein